MKFNQMNLPEFIVAGLAKQNIVDTTEIQEKTLPLIKSGADVVGLSQTGSGKTYAFGIPALLGINQNLPATQVLIICPTRELVNQVTDDLKKLLSHETKIRIQAIVGGANMERQVQALKHGAKIVVGTPGRLMDHLRRKTLRLDFLKTVVLDEADEMLNMGFKNDIETILKATKPERQTVMFSATMPPDIQKIIGNYMREPVTVKTANQDCGHANIKQYFVKCNKTDKVDLFEKIFNQTNPFIAIVFSNTKHMTEKLAKSFKQRNIPAVALHGDMRQSARTRTMDGFKKHGGVLVATDVCARGIDVKNVDIVVNYDFPNNDEYYTHRIGRTGRAGKLGTAFTFVTSIQQLKALSDLARKTGGEVTEYPGLGATIELADEPPTPKKTKKPSFNRKKSAKNQSRGRGQGGLTIVKSY